MRECRGAAAPTSGSVIIGAYAPPAPVCSQLPPNAAAPGCRGRAPRRDSRALRAGGVAHPHADVYRISSRPMVVVLLLLNTTSGEWRAFVTWNSVRSEDKSVCLT